MPKRKSNVKKKQKSKSRTRTISKKTGLKKSTKIIIGVVCVLAIVGIIVGVLVKKGVISSGSNNTPANTAEETQTTAEAEAAVANTISNGLPSKSIMISDSKIIKSLLNKQDNTLDFKNKLLDNYIQRFKLLLMIQRCKFMFSIEKINHIINYLTVGNKPNYFFDEEVFVDNDLIEDTNEYKIFYHIIKIRYLLHTLDYINDFDELKYINIFSNLTIDIINKNLNIQQKEGETDNAYIKRLYCGNDNTDTDCVYDVSNINFNDLYEKYENILVLIKASTNNYINKLLEITKINEINVTINKNDFDNYDFAHKEELLNELFKYNVLDLNYKFLKLKYNHNNINSNFTQKKNFLNIEGNKIEPLNSYMYTKFDSHLYQRNIITDNFWSFYELVVNESFEYAKEDSDNKLIILYNQDNSSNYINEALNILKPILVTKGIINENDDIDSLSDKVNKLKSVSDKEVFEATTKDLKAHNEAYIKKFRENTNIDIENLSGLEEINQLILNDILNNNNITTNNPIDTARIGNNNKANNLRDNTTIINNATVNNPIDTTTIGNNNKNISYF